MVTTSLEFPEAQFEAAVNPAYAGLGSALGDRRDGRVYVYDPGVRAAVRVALASGRPLLLRGPAGSGKSSLAPFVARQLKRRFYWATVTARTEARDLMWQFDALKRLNDAQTQGRKETLRVAQLHGYIEPGVLWWAFDPRTAARRGLGSDRKLLVEEAGDPGIGPRRNGVVVLIDEIDKADPDVPNNLLESLGSLQFRVQETGNVVVARTPPLVIITTNDERELPAAFQRRCAVLYLREHERPELVSIASHHFQSFSSRKFSTPGAKKRLYEAVALKLEELRTQARLDGQREPSTAEYLDAVRASLTLGVDPDDPDGEWPHIQQLSLLKQKPKVAVPSAGGAAAAEPVS